MADCLSLGVAGPHEPTLFALDLPPLTDGGAVVSTWYSGLSAGTELTYVKGTDPGFGSRRDPETGVFVAGEPSRRYPVTAMGYMEVGQVVESRRDDLPIGTVVAGAYGHRSRHVLRPGEYAVPVPEGIDPVLGIYLAQMGPIAANGLLHAAAELCCGAHPALGDGVEGRHVLVTGAGVVGLLTALFVRRAGAAAVVVADPDAHRLAAATRLGLDTIDETSVEAWHWCKDAWVHAAQDRGADLVFQCRGRDEVLHQALRSLRPQGTVIDLAFYQGGSPGLRLGEEFHHNGLTIRCAQIGRVPRGMSPTWDRRRLSEETAALLRAEGPSIRRHMITDVVPIQDAPGAVMKLVRRERKVLQLVFDFGS